MFYLTCAIIVSSLIIPHATGATSKAIMTMRMEAGAQETEHAASPLRAEYLKKRMNRRFTPSYDHNGDVTLTAALDKNVSVTLSPNGSHDMKSEDRPLENSRVVNPERAYWSEFTCPKAQSCSGNDDDECLSRCNTTAKTCDCQGLRLTSVPCNLPEDTEKLHLGNNTIDALNDCVFDRYRSLMHLDLKKNRISKLSENCFAGLTALTELNMEDNILNLTEHTYPASVFLPLVSLQRLKINRNNKVNFGNFSYPDRALSQLKNLTVLFMDGLHDKIFGPGFSAMTSLVNLTLAGYLDGFCNLGALTNVTFANLKSLKMLNISNCHLNGSIIDRDAFRSLSNIEILDLHYNENIGLDNVEKITFGLKDSHLTFLDLSTTESRYSTGKLVNESHVRNLPATLEVLKVAGNSIEQVDTSVFSRLPQNLCHLDVGKNKLVFGRYLCYLPELKNLTSLYLDGEDFLYDIPTTFPFQDGSPLRYSSHRLRRFASRFSCNGTSTTSFSLPEKLTKIEMNNAGLEYRFSALNITPQNSIESLSFDRNYIPELIGPFIGLLSLTNFSISSSFVKYINSSFFANFPMLEFLFLNDNFLGGYFPEPSAESLFHDLNKLKVLEMTFNEIETLPKDLFKGLTSLTHLDLSSNRLRNFNVSISDMKNLTLLNLTSNSVRQLSSDVRRSIDDLLRGKVPIRVDLSDNPIDCTCNNIEFLEWLAAKTEVFGEYDNYRCLREDGSVLVVRDGYSSVLQVLRRECSSNRVLFVIILAATVLALAVIVGLVFYRYRWTIRYLYHAAYLSYQQRKGASSPGDYTYDVFISYAFPDERFVVESVTPELEKRGLKVHVHGRNFVAGNFIASNIVSAVSASRKTLVILTNSLLKSHWCNYEVQMANMESVYAGRPVLVFLLKENIPSHKLGCLISFIRNNTYMPYPQGDEIAERERNAFWDKLNNPPPHTHTQFVHHLRHRCPLQNHQIYSQFSGILACVQINNNNTNKHTNKQKYCLRLGLKVV
ncbi:unnamed protein product [Lymnaea stagnalis]|uniref:TIR domain-containing protein n=1 Tax=Lymnaea stagnalis TaxID=6523 RepID=A0AAV2HXC3_LYMST